MEHLLNHAVKDIQISGIRKFWHLVAKYPDAISLTVGQPDFPTPEHVKTAAKIAIDQNRTTYTDNAGLLGLREAISRFVGQKYGMSYAPNDEIIVTDGASQAIDIALRTILEPGCEVILPGPVYPGYEPIIRLCGGIPVHVDTREHDFKLTAAGLSEKLSNKTRCIILPYPSNPTGCVLLPEELQEIAEVVADKEIFILSDEIYSELVYEGTHVSFATLPGMREKTIVINGLSKSHAMTGWRIGFTLAPGYITRQMLKVHQYSVCCASSISQYAALEALTNGVDDAVPMREEFKRRRDFVYQRLCEMGLEVNKPQGAFYFFPSIQPLNLNMTSFDFAVKLLDECHVAVVPGDGFSSLGEEYVRISYAYAQSELAEGMRRLQQFIERRQTSK